MTEIGINTLRKEAWEKVTGRAKYNGDTITSDMLHGRILTSTYAHALIKKIDISKAKSNKGVRAIVIGEDCPILTGSIIKDRPILARDRVRYFGEPVALVIADSEQEAMEALALIEVEYEALPIINSIEDAIKENAPLIHEDLGHYAYPDEEVYPIAHSNIAHEVKIRKGNIDSIWEDCDVEVEYEFSIPQSDHLAMETRNARAKISSDGTVHIYTSSQAPFGVKEELSKNFKIPEGKVIVYTPLVGGGFGGKASITLEYLAYLGSNAVGGRMVRISNSREQDMASSPAKLGAKGKVKLGARKDGKLLAMKSVYYVDCGAYSDTGPRMTRAIATDCSGPYNIENVYCDAFTVYTNHTYATSYRGFGHGASTLGIEGALNKLAKNLDMDSFELRRINAIKSGDISPTGEQITLSNSGDLQSCILRLKDLIKWEEGNRIITKDGKIRTKGISCFWKTSSSPINASSGVILTFNSDGSINMNFGATEIGPGTKTIMAQILAEKLKMKVEDINVYMDVNTQVTPLHWKTVASMSTLMIGNATIAAGDDLVKQLKEVSAKILKCNIDDLDIKDKRVFVTKKPHISLEFQNLVQGYEYESGPGIYGQILGHGTYIMNDLIPLDKETGRGKSGVSWTVGAQAVEVEYDPELYTYRLIKAATVADIGKVINPKAARGVVMGGMSMGLGLGTREEFVYDKNGILQDTSLRTYKLLHFGEQPEYIVDFIETPQLDGPFGARGIGEHGILGMPSALIDAISLATEEEFNTIPISPELIWKTKTGEKI